jgi:two-component system sensor histidine kinase SenX3
VAFARRFLSTRQGSMETTLDFGPSGESDPARAALDRVERLADCLLKVLRHDLPAHLVAIHGLVRVLQEEQGPRLGPEGQGHLARVAGQAQRADALVRAMVEVGRLTRDLGPAEPVALADVAAEVAAEMNVLFSGQRIQYHFQQDLPVFLVSRRALYQVLAQLFRNAVQAAVPERPPRIELGGRCLRAEPLAPEGVEFWIADNGRGLAAADALFEYREGGRAGTGRNGLGLFLVRQVVAGWGGVLRVRSEAGRGTTFTIRVPSADKATR